MEYRFDAARARDGLVAAVQAQEDWIEFLWCPLAELASANLLPEAFRALAADPDILFEP